MPIPTFVRTLALVMLGGIAAGVQAQTKLLASIFFPAAHPVYAQVMVPWAKDVEAATGGSITFEFAPSSLAPPPGQLDMVGKGIADVAIQFVGLLPNRLHLSLVGEQFGPITNAEAMSHAMWRTHQKFFVNAGEYKDFKLLSLVSFPPARLYTTKEPITTIDQLRRAKIAVTPGTYAKAYGAVTNGVVAVPAVRFFELVSKGTVDAFVVTPIELYGFNLIGGAKQEMKFEGTGTTTGIFAIVLNQNRWKALNRTQQDAIDKLSGEAFAPRMKALDTAAEGARRKAAGDGMQMVEASAAFNADLAKAFAFTVDEWVAEANKRGTDGKAALDFFRAEHVRLAGGK